MSELSKLAQPAPGSAWVDIEGRTLIVAEVHPGDRLGREVIGTMDDRPYSCPLTTWADVWRDDAPRLPIHRQKAGG